MNKKKKGYYGGPQKMYADKRLRKQQRKQEDQDNKLKEKNDDQVGKEPNYELREYKIGNVKFDEYYRA